MKIALCLIGALVMHVQVAMSNDISCNEIIIDAFLAATVSGLTGDYDDQVSCPE